MKLKSAFLFLLALGFCFQLKAQRNPGMYNTRVVPDTLDMDRVVNGFNTSKKSDGVYDIYTFKDGIKIRVECKGGVITKYHAVDANNNPIIPQTMSNKNKPGRRICWVALKDKAGNQHFIQRSCPDFGDWE